MIERMKAAFEAGNMDELAQDVYWVASSTNTSDTMEVYEQVVRIDSKTNTQTFTATLPNVSAARGKIYVITGTLCTGYAITLQDNDDDAGLTNITLDADGEYVVLYSDGRMWYELCTGYS